jgi:hypothetical protein
MTSMIAEYDQKLREALSIESRVNHYETTFKRIDQMGDLLT